MIRLLVGVAGADFAYSAGETVSLDPKFEQRLLESGQAEPAATKRGKTASVKAGTIKQKRSAAVSKVS